MYPLYKTEVISSKYVIQYTCAAITMATRVTIMEDLGIGWFFSISECCDCW